MDNIKVVKIPEEESEQVKALFYQFRSYCNILGYLAQYGSIDTNAFDRKWEEAAKINNDLEELKAQLDQKYHPTDGEYTNYRFDFDNHSIVYEL